LAWPLEDWCIKCRGVALVTWPQNVIIRRLRYISETSQSTAECELKEQRDQVAQWVGHPVGLEGGCAPPRRIFFDFQVKNAGF